MTVFGDKIGRGKGKSCSFAAEKYHFNDLQITMENIDFGRFAQSLEKLTYEENIYIIEKLSDEIDVESYETKKQLTYCRETDRSDSAQYFDLKERFNELEKWHDELKKLKDRLSNRILDDVMSEIDWFIVEHRLDHRIKKNRYYQYHAKYGRFNYILQPEINGNNSGIDIRLDSTLDFDEYDCALQIFADTCGLYFMQGSKFIGVGVPFEKMADKMIELLLKFEEGFQKEQEQMEEFNIQEFETRLKELQYEDKIKLIQSTRFRVQNILAEWVNELKYLPGNHTIQHRIIHHLNNEYKKFDALWMTSIHGFLNEALRKADEYITAKRLNDRIVIRRIENNKFFFQVYELRYLCRSCTLAPMADIITGQFLLQISGKGEKNESYRDVNKAIAQYLNIDYKYGPHINIEVAPAELAERLIELIGKAD